MRADKGKRTGFMVLTIALNAVLITCVVLSVLFAFRNAEEVNFNQNIENVRTLTDAAANRVELEITHRTRETENIARYVNSRMGGMTEQEVRDYFVACYGGQEDYSWQLVNGVVNGKTGSGQGFDAISLQTTDDLIFLYRAKAYPELARIFSRASADTLGEISYTSEFTDSSPVLAKSFAVTTPVRLREEEGGYRYKTLMLLIKSDHINTLISKNNNMDNLSFFDFSGIIIDDNGNYVISSSYFQGTNFLDYIALYNDNFTQAGEIRAKLRQPDYSDVLYYQNNRGQDCAYTIVPVQNSDWHVLSIVPLDSFHDVEHSGDSYMRFFLSFLLLFVVDMTFVLLLNRQLRRKKQEAEAASLAKSQFLSSMSHDIRTPMNAIIGMTVIANETLAEAQPDRETLVDCVKTIELSGNHLLTLINDILDISKIESGKVALSPDDFSISETMSKMLEIVQPQIKEKNFRFETHIVNVTHEFVRADELRLNQVFINILSNAIKYTNPGGRITVDLMEEALPDRTDAARFIYRVSDNGIGMDPEFQKAVFERFTRAVDTRINTVQGTGLGLSIVKQLVDLMGGTIEVQSELNVGSTFTVTLDLPVGDIRAESVSLKDVSALLIDDDRILLETAEMSLVKAGMVVETTTQGQQGVEMAAERQREGSPYDVIMVDWRMTGMNGIEVVRALRRRLGPGIKIVVMTAYSIADIEREGRQAGANSFITKPLFQSKLLHTIQSLFTEESQKEAPPAKQTFDLQVLVTEDNQTNWRVLDKLLRRYGIEAEWAENGLVAVEKVTARETPYDLILMDIQMPVLNGYRATDEIRALENPAKAQTPIYAMTADTFAEDVEKCLARGMNGHLAKPVEIDKLQKLLAQLDREKEDRERA